MAWCHGRRGRWRPLTSVLMRAVEWWGLGLRPLGAPRLSEVWYLEYNIAIYIHKHISISISISVSVSISLYIYIHIRCTYVYIYIYVCHMYVCVCMYVCMCVRTYTFPYANAKWDTTDAYIHAYIHTQIPSYLHKYIPYHVVPCHNKIRTIQTIRTCTYKDL